MDKSKLQPLKGFRDFLPEEARKRQQVINSVRKEFELFGFEPLETPALEYKELLTGKYGEEADKLIYSFKDRGERDVALRYDQTVPTARILAMYKEQLPMPWRRYQIQNVWRAENPQKGRFREFLQCDADIYGTESTLADAEIVAVTYSALKKLGFAEVSVLINDRAILFSVIENAGIRESSRLSVLQSIDKLDKKSREDIETELIAKGITVQEVHAVFDTISKAEPTENLKEVMHYAEALGVDQSALKFTPRLARGLDYYTSTIFEFTINGYEAGSVAGGGRYNNLIEQLSGVSVPAVGIAFGFDRVVEAMAEFGLFTETSSSTEVLVTVFNDELAEVSAEAAGTLRLENIASEVYPYAAKLEKQLKYADKKHIPWLIVIGPDEAQKGSVVLKNLVTGHQEDLPLNQVPEKIKGQ